MSDSEEDFMSDKFLATSVKEDIRPGLLFNAQKRKHEVLNKQDDLKKKRPKSYREQEKETREKGMTTAISSENIGFKMLEKMGFKAGSSLGKTNSGLVEPVTVIVKEDVKSGVGLEMQKKEAVRNFKVYSAERMQNIEKEFKATNYEKNLMAVLRRDYFKAQKICEELDFKNEVSAPLHEFFWTRATLSKMNKTKFEDSEEESEEEEEPEEISQEKLHSMIEYLRAKYFYCIFCAITGSDKEDLNTDCPGPFRSDHDEFD